MSTTRTALARLYRPRRFGEMAMQEHVSETLKAAVACGRVAHAYLFSGPRGVGKTTAARVLAMALNCPARGESGEPCGECESCDRIWAGRTSLDVVEIDAASNRGVEDARELRERAMYAPTDEKRYKVYIIDEAHMLTREAWNALLKILEEPPPRVIFVFATTEPQKIQQSAPPILSRCQRFDFRRISVAAIVSRLRSVLAAEGVEAEEQALVPLARRAEGGLRDALSLLDQVLSFSGGRVTSEDVRRVLGLVGEELYLEVFEIVAQRRHGEVFRFVERLLDEGYDPAEFYRGLADAVRTLLVVKFQGADAAEVREDLREAFAGQAARFQEGDLLRMLAQVVELDADGRLRKSASPRLLLEALLLRFAHLDRTIEIEELIRASTAGAARIGEEVVQRPETMPVPPTPPPHPPPRTAPRRATTPEQEAAEAALHAVLEQGQGLPRGLALLLKAARVVGADARSVTLALPAGPGAERLSDDPAARQALEQGMAQQLGRGIQLEIRQEGGAPQPSPLPPAGVRDQQLTRLTRDEPLLGRAVEEWDLELLE
ncbi:MAG: DNA polymerase III subunit gamma/tau [Gemmatimonadetes bacterium]|nr:DNA polymerase III subunit gamma/tau [Gemmatimonadota bacterium]